ncbi:MAG TPA: META domain-containing protein [Azospira sp.]|nr:META domain-containing protein [Azospira sp.]HNN44496.1 META domain-containing protein [Azospira sp.]
MPRIVTLLLPALLTLVTACASKPGPLPARSKDPTMITGTTWQWEETQTPVEKITSPAPDRYTLLLLPDGRANSRFDCNRGGGSYRIVEPGRISFGTMATTMMACPPGSLDRRFAKDLGQAGGYFVEGGKLYLELPADSGTMRFRPGQ